jgi:magnesium-protoporphyrin O-methyltransferase
MSGCCRSAFESAADQQFDQHRVAQELKRYRQKGPGPTARLLMNGIARDAVAGGTVLDIGSGIGALTFAMLERGASSAVAVDASAAYVAASRAEAARSGRLDAIRFVHADFVVVASELPSATLVTLDRVVCCYPSCTQLLEAAAAHADRCVALSYPRQAWYVRAASGLENGRRWLGRNPFRTFVHPVAAIEGTITGAGFRLSSRRESWTWSADVYVRP